jgi:hypothetical protein
MPIYRVRTSKHVVREFIVDAADREAATAQAVEYPESLKPSKTLIQIHMDTDHSVSISDSTKQDWLDETRKKKGK